MFFEAYGWTPCQFINMTMRQIVAFSYQIQSSEIDKKKFFAAIQGAKFETDFENHEPSTNLSSEQEQKALQHLERLNKGKVPGVKK